MKTTSIPRTLGLFLAGITLILFTSAGKISAQTEQVLHSFQGGADGATPYSGLIADSAGALYGSTSTGGPHGHGMVYKLTPPSGSGTGWTETIIYAFNDGLDGSTPISNLVMDSSGVIYGTTSLGGVSNCGTFFRLTPPGSEGEAWTVNTLVSFPCASKTDTQQSPGNIVLDPTTGVFYGALGLGGALNGGMVYQLAPAAGGWNYAVIYSFDGDPQSPGYLNGNVPFNLALGPKGDLYGTALYGGLLGGVIFQLSPPGAGGGQWNETVLLTFDGSLTSPNGFRPYGLVIDKNGVLYGGSQEGGSTSKGVIYSLTPPATSGQAWTQKILHSFGRDDGYNPLSGVILGPKGLLYGSTEGGGSGLGYVCAADFGCGTVFQLTPTSKGPWTETILYKFTPNSFDAQSPNVGQLLLLNGTLYGSTYDGGSMRVGAVYSVTP